MTPLAFISGILLGTAFCIFFGLAVVAFLYALLGLDTPRIATEIGPLLSYSLMFLVMTITSGLGFILLVKNHQYRWYAQAVMWGSWVLAITWALAQRA